MKAEIKNINNKKFPSYFFVVIFIISVFVIPSMVSAADPIPTQTGTYTLLAPLPLSGGGSSDTTVTLGGEEQFRTYLNNAFKIGITIAILLAVIMIVIGGIQWMGESVFGKESGKKKIQDAMTGLVLALAIFLILNTINPDLVNLRLKIDNLTPPPAILPSATSTSSLSAGRGLGKWSEASAQQAIDTDMGVRQQLAVGSSNITVKTNYCDMGLFRQWVSRGNPNSGANCTTVGRLNNAAISGLIKLSKDCACSFMVTGGTEWGHTTHFINYPVVDIGPNAIINRFITKSSAPPTNGQRATLGGATYTYEVGGVGGSTGDHWHVQF